MSQGYPCQVHVIKEMLHAQAVIMSRSSLIPQPSPRQGHSKAIQDIFFFIFFLVERISPKLHWSPLGLVVQFVINEC